MLFLFGIFVVLLICSAFFSASETAITFASRPKLHQLAKDGNKKALLIKSLQDRLSMVISAMLAYNTLLNAAIASVLASISFQLFGDNSTMVAVLSSIVTGITVLVFAEMLPKTLAIQNTMRFLLFFGKAINFFFNLFLPINRFFSFIVHGIMKLLGQKPNIDFANASLEELKGAIDMHDAPGQDTAQEKAMLKSILDLGRVQLSEIMVHRQHVTMVDAKESIPSIVEHILACPYTRLPIWENDTDNIIGVINTKAVLRAIKAHAGNLKDLSIKDIASKPWFVPESTDLLEQLQAFRKRREHIALVVDEYGAFMGIVTLEDILEEIVGDIADEHDIAVKGVRPVGTDSYLVHGNVTIRDLNRQFDWGLPDHKAATIAGLMIYHFRTIPKVGQIFHLEKFRLEVMRRQGNQVTLIKITVSHQRV